VSARDTLPGAAAVQAAIYRRMTASERSAMVVQMSMSARAITLAAIRTRHPEYDEDQARWALFRLLVGDDLFRRAWPGVALLAP
jgi:hypothetical protein